MMLDPYSCEREKELSTQKALAGAEQARLARLAKGHREPRRWHLLAPMAAAVDSLKAFLMRRRHAGHVGRSAQSKVPASGKTAAHPR
jgi:hypothetical protein